MSKQLRITQVKSTCGRLQNQIRTLSALGLGRIRQTVTKGDTPQIRGMIAKVEHLVKVEEIGEQG